MFLKIPMGVPVWDNKLLYQVIKEIISGHIFRSSQYYEILQKELCKLLKVKYCLLTELGRIALEIGLKSLKLKAGDGVILPSYACTNVLLPVLKLKCEPQFADIGEDLNINPESIEKTIKPNTKAIIVPHLYGCPAPIKEILEIARQKGLYVIDDAAQSLGAKVNGQYTGTFGDIGILSFGPFKIISATRGGALVTNNPQIFKRLQNIKIKKASEKAALDRLWKSFIKFKCRKYSYFLMHIYKKYKNKKISENILLQNNQINFTDYPKEYIAMSNLDAFLVYLQLKKLNFILNKRKFLGKKLLKQISIIMPNILIHPHMTRDNVFLKVVIKLKLNTYTRSKIIKLFQNQGIEVQAGYTPLHLKFNFYKLPFTESIWHNILTLPINSNMNINDIKFVIQKLQLCGQILKDS